MTATPLHGSPHPLPRERRAILLVALMLVAAAFAAYANSFSTPFVFDDLPDIVDNPTIRHLGNLGEILAPHARGGLTVSGRPIVNLSLAINYAISGVAPWSYHIANLVFHVAAGCLLLGIIRRTLLSPPLQPSLGQHALPIAATITSLWLLHPLQVESVTYTVQRAESLCSLFYLATLHAFIRGATSSRPRVWWSLAFVACLLGMATKEIMVTAPLIVLLYDRTFLAGNVRAAWRQRWHIHTAFAATWLLLIALVASTAGRGGTAGFGTAISPWTYALTQCQAIVLYLRLSVWPSPLVFDYGIGTVANFSAIWPQAVLLTALLAATLVALVRRPALGFAAACFFLLLAPSSSVVPIATQTMAEHRMYLALAPLIAATVAGLYLWMGARSLFFFGAAAVALGFATHLRNHDYRSDLALWTDTATKFPTNARAHNNLGKALFADGQIEASLAPYERALALQPNFPEPAYNLGVSLTHLNRLPAAVARYEEALRLKPDQPEAHNNLGSAEELLGRLPSAIEHYERALQQRPDYAEAHKNLGSALLQMNRPDEAIAHLQRALKLKPTYPEAHYHLGNALATTGHMPAALAEFRAALLLKPDYGEARINAGNALLQLDRPVEAIADYQQAIALAPRLADAHYNLGNALLLTGRWADAINPFETALRLDPGYASAHRGLGLALAKTGRIDEALAHYEACLRASPNEPGLREELAQLRARR